MGCINSVPDVGRLKDQRSDKIQYFDEVAFEDDLLYDIRPNQMNQPMHRHIVAIIWRNAGVGKGSGLLISKNLVLTTAHNIIHNMQKVDRKLIQIYISPCGTMKNPYKVQSIYFPPKYLQVSNQQSIRYDYALLKLQQKVDTTDFISLKAYDYDQIKEISIYGYPSDRYRSQSKRTNQESTFQAGKTKSKRDCFIEVRKERQEILYRLSTLKGQSGSPILQQKGGILTVIGIHKAGLRINSPSNQHKLLNAGRLITNQLIKQLQIHTDNLGAEPFQVYKQNPIKKQQQQLPNAIIPKPEEVKFSDGLEEQLEKQYMLSSKPQQIDESLSVEELMRRGDELFYRDQFKRARQYYRRIIKFKPYHSNAYYSMGLTLQENHLLEPAIKAFKRAVGIDSRNFKAHYSLGCCYELVKKKQQAKSSFKKCLEINPMHKNASLKLSSLL